MAKVRIDSLLAERGLVPSRAGAALEVRAGRVRIGRDGQIASKPSQMVTPDAELSLAPAPRFVSRGGLKLDHALEVLGLDVSGVYCLDVGASTGGFTDCLLERGAARVIALDVGYGQLAASLRADPRVEVMERVNVRRLSPGQLPWRPRLATIDVSFISLAKVLPAVVACLAPGGEILALVKPQFELGRERVKKGGVVRDPSDRREAVLGVAREARRLGLVVRGFAGSGLPGPKGNRETFAWLSLGGAGIEDVESAVLAADPDVPRKAGR